MLRSRLEEWLEPRLISELPDLKIDFNKKDLIGSEADIAFPELKMIVELQGGFHYFPIFGPKVLEMTQKNDQLKREACARLDIKLLEINTSHIGYVTAKTGWKILREILKAVKDRKNELNNGM